MRKLIGKYGVYIKTGVPPAFFQSHLEGTYDVISQPTDVGCFQRDFIHIDTEKTLQQLDLFYRDHAERISAETRWLDRNRIDLILSDVPSYPLRAGETLGTPRLVMSNFTWYDIYSAFPGSDKWRTLLDVLRDEYSTATLQLLPQCHIDNNVIAKKEVVGFIGLKGKDMRGELERLFPDRIKGKTLVYIYFGQFDSSTIQWANLEKIKDCAFITRDPLHRPPENVIVLGEAFYHPDLIASADIVCTKAGYSTLATAFIHGKPVVSCDREGFREVDAMKNFMTQNQVGLIIDAEKFYAGDWADAIKSASRLTVHGKVRLDGETDVSQKINNLLQ